MVRPQVINGPTSPGQQVCTGSLVRSTSSPSSITSWQGASLTTLGAMASTLRKIGSLLQASFRPLGGSGSLRKASSLPISRSSLTSSAPMPKATRLGVPNRLPSTGMSKPVGFSNSSAGPPLRRVRSQISVISSTGETGALIRLSSPRCSRPRIKSRRSRYCMLEPHLRRTSRRLKFSAELGYSEEAIGQRQWQTDKSRVSPALVRCNRLTLICASWT